MIRFHSHSPCNIPNSFRHTNKKTHSHNWISFFLDMSKNETSQRITGAEIQSVYSTDENIPGQIPFVSFDEKDLTKFKNEILANRKSNDSSELPEDAESYLRNCLRRLSRNCLRRSPESTTSTYLLHFFVFLHRTQILTKVLVRSWKTYTCYG